MPGTLRRRWSKGGREVAESALAAGVAWWLGTLIFGVHEPIFAAIAAIVCLAPGLPSHSKQALGMLAGVIFGILVGEAVLLSPLPEHAAILGLAVFIAMIGAISLGVKPIIGIQAGATAVIVIAENEPAEGLVRMGDALIGGGVALLFSQVLFTPDPFAKIRKGARKLLEQAGDLRDRFDDCRTKSENNTTLRQMLAELRDAERDFVDRLDFADHIASRTLRGRLRKKDIESLTEEWRVLARELHLALGSLGYVLEHQDDDDVASRCDTYLGEADELINQAQNKIDYASDQE